MTNQQTRESVKITKAALIDDLYERLNGQVSKKVLSSVYDAMGHQMMDHLRDGHVYPLPMVGRLSASRSGPRKARNPSTGETIEVPPRNRLQFKPTETAKRYLNE